MYKQRAGGQGDGGTEIRGREAWVEGAGSGGIGAGSGSRGGGKRGERGGGKFLQSLKGVRHVLNPNAKRA